MKKILFLFALLFTLYSCQDTVETSDQILEEEQMNTRSSRDCFQKFTPGNIEGNLFGNPNWATFNDEGWQGTFESQFFPCPGYIDPGNCCQNTEIETFFFDPLSISAVCNKDLDAQELQDLADEITALITANPPVCEGVELTPVDLNVMVAQTLCCPFNQSPCPELNNPCDCFDDFPDDPYWGCCESYSLELEVKYARTVPCKSELTEG